MRVAALCLAVLTLASWSFAERSGRDLTPAELANIRGGYGVDRCLKNHPDCPPQDLPYYVDDCASVQNSCYSYHRQESRTINGNKICVSQSGMSCNMEGNPANWVWCRRVWHCVGMAGECEQLAEPSHTWKVPTDAAGTNCP